VRVALSILLFVLYIFLIRIISYLLIVVTVHFVKLPLSQPTSFRLFLSILLHTPAAEGTTEQSHGPVLLAMAKLQHCLTALKKKKKGLITVEEDRARIKKSDIFSGDLSVLPLFGQILHGCPEIQLVCMGNFFKEICF